MTLPLNDLLETRALSLIDMEEAKRVLLVRIPTISALTEAVRKQQSLPNEKLELMKKHSPEAYEQRQASLASTLKSLDENVLSGFKTLTVVQILIGKQAARLIAQDVTQLAEVQDAAGKLMCVCAEGFELCSAPSEKTAEVEVDPLAEALARYGRPYQR